MDLFVVIIKMLSMSAASGTRAGSGAVHAESPAAVAAELYIYDLGSACGISIRERNPRPADGGGGPPKAFKEKASADYTGWTVWASSVLLSRWLLENAATLSGKTVVELGSGCGLAGILAARSSKASTVLLTDYQEHTLQNLRFNIDLACGKCSPDGEWVAPRSGARVRTLAVNWDDEDTYPKGPSGAPIADVLLVSDATYRRSYGRKLAVAVDGMLAPGGRFVYASPVAREGLPILVQMLERFGFTDILETPVPPEWRRNPLRSAPLHCAEAAATATASGEAGGVGGAGSSAAAVAVPDPATTSALPVRYVADDEARCMFPELAMEGYEFVIVTATKPHATSA